MSSDFPGLTFSGHHDGDIVAAPSVIAVESGGDEIGIVLEQAGVALGVEVANQPVRMNIEPGPRLRTRDR
jgi:hypothetical protein